MNDERLLDYAEFVATKFSKNMDGWKYSRDTGGLKHIRYESDYTGYNHWTKRVRRALRAWNPVRYWRDKGLFSDRDKSVKGYFIHAWAYATVALRPDNNLPDGQINGIITHWEEDGEYIALFQPRVGVKVLEFIKADPENPYARAILDEMHAMSELSCPSKDADD